LLKQLCEYLQHAMVIIPLFELFIELINAYNIISDIYNSKQMGKQPEKLPIIVVFVKASF